MVKWYLATYQNSVFSSDLGIIEPSGDNVYKLKNGIQSGESPEEKDWLRITDNKVEEWDGSSWTEDATLTGLVNNSTYWIYGEPCSYKIVTNDQTYYLKSFSNDQNEDTNTRIITRNDINNSEVSIDDVTTITAVTIGPSVTSIGDNAFYGCSSLTSVNITDSVTEIGEFAFYGCSSLTSLKIGDSVTTIGNNAFEHCSSLASLIIGEKVETIGDSAFQYCSSLTSLKIGDSVTTIGNNAFEYCTSLASVTIPNSVKIIGNYAFQHCSSLTSLIIGEKVDTIGTGAFGHGAKLLTLIIPDSVRQINPLAFYGIAEFFSQYDAVIIISQSTVRRLTGFDTYDSGSRYKFEHFFSGSTLVTLYVT